MSNTEQNNSKEETKSDDAEVSEAIVTGKVPPAYGSKEYWDQRYEKLLVADHDDDDNNNGDGSQQAVELNGAKTSDEEATKSSVNDNDDDPVAFHSWYFSYDDLKPIILPLILGGKEEVERLLGDTEEKDGDDDDNDDNDDNNANKSVNETESPPPMLKTSSKSGKQDSSADEDGSDNSDAGEDGWEEVAGNESVDSEEGEAEISQTEAGLVIESPVAVLEVGCGDVPLVLGLADDLGKLEAPSSKTTKPIVNRIVCTDYSATLIRTLERIHQKKRKLPGTSNAGDGGTVSALKASAESTSGETSKPTIEYMVADARELPFPDKSFHLILEKGTMDAMISDSEVGVSNCIGIVSDCARVLATGGKYLSMWRLSHAGILSYFYWASLTCLSVPNSIQVVFSLYPISMPTLPKVKNGWKMLCSRVYDREGAMRLGILKCTEMTMVVAMMKTMMTLATLQKLQVLPSTLFSRASLSPRQKIVQISLQYL